MANTTTASIATISNYAAICAIIDDIAADADAILAADDQVVPDFAGDDAAFAAWMAAPSAG